MLNLAPEFPFVGREIKRVPNHILNMLDRARDKRPYDSNINNDHNTRYHRKRSRDHHSLFVDPYLRHVSDQAYVLERGQELDVSKQVGRLRFLLDVDREGDQNLWEQKWEKFDVVHRRNDESEMEDTDTDDDDDDDLSSHVIPTKSTTSTLVDHVTHPSDHVTEKPNDTPTAESPTTTRRFGGRLRSFVKKHTRGRSRDRVDSRRSSVESSVDSREDGPFSRDEPPSSSTTRSSSLDTKHDSGRFTWYPKGVESNDQSGAESRDTTESNGSHDQSGTTAASNGLRDDETTAHASSKPSRDQSGTTTESREANAPKGSRDAAPSKPSHTPESPGFSTTFQHRFQNELNLIAEHPFAPSVFQATGTMFKLRSKGLVRQYLPNLPFRGSHFEQTKQSARAILLMDRCVDAKDRCLKINDFWGKYGLSTKDQVNFMYTTCFYELIREVAMNANRIISQLFEDDETKVRRKYKRQRAHRLWEMGDWLVKRGAELAAKRGLHVTHNPEVKPDDVVSSIVAVVSYMEFVVINHRPYQTQTRINYNFVKDGVDWDGHVTGDKSNPIHKAAASLWTPWAVASCNPLTLADPERAEEFSSFDFRYEDVFKKNKDECECGVALFQ